MIKINIGKVANAFFAPEIFLCFVALVAFWATIVQPENVLPEEHDPSKKDNAIYSPLILKEAAEVEAARLFTAGKTDQAVRKASELVREKPHDVLSLMAAGNVLFAAGDKQEGLRLLKRSVALAPRSRFVRINLAEKLTDNQNFDEAVTQYQMISTAYPRWSKPHEALGRIYVATNRHMDAAQQFELALEGEPNNGTLRKERGLCLARAGEGRAGLDEYIRGDATELVSGPPPDIKQIITQWGSLDRAIFQLKKELQSRPDEPELKLRLGRIYMFTGQTLDAKQSLMEAKKKAPSNPVIHRNLALVMQKLGESNVALSEFMLSINLEKNQKS